MLINEVENIVGLSKKTIRYYEENGLLNPRRNKDNDYRIYDDDDITKLKKLKFLRELDVSIRELQLLEGKEISLADCLRKRCEKINDNIDSYQKIREMCEEMINSNVEYDDIDIDDYFININVLNKEGFILRSVKTGKKRRIVECIVSSLLFSMLFIFFIVLFTYFQGIEEEQMPWILYWFLVVMFSFPIIGIIYNLIVRIKEINGGEEDEASKY